MRKDFVGYIVKREKKKIPSGSGIFKGEGESKYFARLIWFYPLLTSSDYLTEEEYLTYYASTTKEADSTQDYNVSNAFAFSPEETTPFYQSEDLYNYDWVAVQLKATSYIHEVHLYFRQEHIQNVQVSCL